MMPLFDEAHVCEGCGRFIGGKLPVGWAECGVASRDSKRLAAWCVRCQLDGSMERKTQEKKV
jgi:hypothetical protein